ncbi:hypothetical protein V5O48_007667 [Marasmius crinis-equi]|uniref:Uncharacterized protein n=1 Tax=Marasmius crinis-equi TaxID=585013 RepID=A0ABR3FG05_9AGAR
MHWQMGPWSNLWLDTSRGVFCCGPEGPEREHGIFGWTVKDLPLDAELLQEDVMLRYLISKKLDRQAVTALSYPSHHEFSRVKVDRSTAISTRTNTILAVVRTVWHAWSGFGERTELPDGVTRFTLSNRRQKQLYLSNSDGWSAWTAQASSVFYAHGVPLEGDLCEYRLILPYLSGGLMSSKAKQRIRKQFSPIYLFIPPSSTSTLWSFDLDGRIPISKDLCRYLGLPVRLRPNHWEYSGEASTYQRLRDYQAARGFDPTTTDFARQLGYPIYDVVDQPLPSRFEELDNPDTIEISSSSTQQDAASAETWPEAADFSLGILFGDAQPADEPIPVSLGLLGASTSNFAVPTQADKTKPEEQGTITTRTNMWSSLISTFSWAAMEDSDIPSAGF